MRIIHLNRSARHAALALGALLWVLYLAVGGSAQQPPAAARPKPRSPEASTPPPAGEGAPLQDEEVVRVDANLTNILLTAIGKDRHFVTTLRQQDLRVLEDGAPQQILTFQRETDLPLSLAILIDTSESQVKVLPDEKEAARTFINSVVRPEKDRTAVISFTGIARLEQPLTGDVNKVRGAIDRVKAGLSAESAERIKNDEPPLSFEQDPTGYTSVWDAIWETTNEVLSHAPERTRRAIILLSDGDDTSSRTKRQEAIDFAIKHDVVVYSIGIRDKDFHYGKLDVKALRKVSEHTGGRAFFPQNKAELLASFAQIQDELRSQYLIAYSPANKRLDGAYRQIRVDIVNPELRRQNLRLLYRQGYYARQQTARRTN